MADAAVGGSGPRGGLSAGQELRFPGLSGRRLFLRRARYLISAVFETSCNAAYVTPIERKAVSKPLTGIRVLDLSKVLAGPLCAQYLGDLRAAIIKVKALGQGDEKHGWPPFPAPGLCTVFFSGHRNN